MTLKVILFARVLLHALLLLLLLLLQTTVAPAQAPSVPRLRADVRVVDLPHCAVPIDQARITEGLARVYGREHYGPVEGVKPFPVTPSSRPLSSWIAPLLDRLSVAAFGRAGVVGLLACDALLQADGDSHGCGGAQWDMSRMAIGVDPDEERYTLQNFPKEELQAQMAFTLAHELGHYIQNILIHEIYTSTPFLSVGSHRLDWRTDYGARWQVHLDVTHGQDHAEVDAIGLALLRKISVDEAPAIRSIERIWRDGHALIHRLDKQTLDEAARKDRDRLYQRADVEIRRQAVSSKVTVDPSRCFE